MSRSKRKGPYIRLNFLKALKKPQTKILQQVSWDSEIMASFIDQEFNVYNGKTNIKVKVTKEMIGHKFGEFSFTRAQFKFKKK